MADWMPGLGRRAIRVIVNHLVRGGGIRWDFESSGANVDRQSRPKDQHTKERERGRGNQIADTDIHTSRTRNNRNNKTSYSFAKALRARQTGTQALIHQKSIGSESSQNGSFELVLLAKSGRLEIAVPTHVNTPNTKTLVCTPPKTKWASIQHKKRCLFLPFFSPPYSLLLLLLLLLI